MLKDFKIWLKNKKLSDKSIKNYLSDVRQFLRWTAKTRLTQLTPNTFSTYKSHLKAKKTPTKSINRYLSSLRRFGQFLKQEKQMMLNPAQNLKNIKKTLKPKKKAKSDQQNQAKPKNKAEKVLENFKKSLKQEKLSKATIKNYSSDISQFLTWLGKN